jgi:hypothetical protein
LAGNSLSLISISIANDQLYRSLLKLFAVHFKLCFKTVFSISQYLRIWIFFFKTSLTTLGTTFLSLDCAQPMAITRVANKIYFHDAVVELLNKYPS